MTEQGVPSMDLDRILDELPELASQAIDLYLSGAEKIMARNPSWPEFLTLLTEDEQRVFWAFHRATLAAEGAPR